MTRNEKDRIVNAWAPALDVELRRAPQKS